MSTPISWGGAPIFENPCADPRCTKERCALNLLVSNLLHLHIVQNISSLPPRSAANLSGVAIFEEHAANQDTDESNCTKCE